ncbi:zinc ribbon domain-containing protein [Calditerrivibrio nitroreducens]|uniref:Putative zinc-ribbon domain-containing protein n=1 Tax=Calditerrivibrio nitroreducens (strain DSM 19672 / NBRC 101217 / Yu37-1) TaxID=768670 RepID=E4TH66_CALNY|nr:zinc ribbon domain-containing protein [Calditerrivibrio nitroreducens]ADR18760.1 hypothetical protein Calni_0849 [Calditerrivibrio nitroreducens DSM 19672]
MKQVKQGRVPSKIEFFSSIAAIIFAIFWIIGAVEIGAPFVFPLFGIVFIIIGIAYARYSYKNAFGEKRFSEYDIVDESEEDEIIKREMNDTGALNYCPYCGNPVKESFSFCPKCGKKIK